MQPDHAQSSRLEQAVYRYASILFAVLALAHGARQLLDSSPAAPQGVIEWILWAIRSFSFAALALLFAWKSEHREAWVVGLSLAAMNLMSNAPQKGSSIIVYAVAAVSFIRSTQTFPNPLTAEDLRRLIRSERTSRIFAFWLRPLHLWLGFGGMLVFVIEGLGLSSTFPNLVILGFGLTGMWANYRTSGETDRRRLFWILQATVWTLCFRLVKHSAGLLAASLNLDMPSYVSTSAGLIHDLGVTVFFLLAVFHAGAINARLALTKTAIHSLSISLLIFSFAIVENYLSGYLAELLSLEDRFVSAMAGAAVGLTFNPLREGLSRIASRLQGRTASPSNHLLSTDQTSLAGRG